MYRFVAQNILTFCHYYTCKLPFTVKGYPSRVPTGSLLW